MYRTPFASAALSPNGKAIALEAESGRLLEMVCGSKKFADEDGGSRCASCQRYLKTAPLARERRLPVGADRCLNFFELCRWRMRLAVAKRGAQDGQGCRSPPWVMARWNCAGLRAPATSQRRKRRPFSTPTLDEQAHYEAEAIRMADDSHYGLADYIWTQRYRQRAARGAAIESGWVQVRQGWAKPPGTPTAATSRAALAASSRSRECSRALHSAKNHDS